MPAEAGGGRAGEVVGGHGGAEHSEEGRRDVRREGHVPVRGLTDPPAGRRSPRRERDHINGFVERGTEMARHIIRKM